MKALTLLSVLCITCINAQETPRKKLRDTLTVPKTYDAKSLDSLQIKALHSKNKMPVHKPNSNIEYYMNVKKVSDTSVKISKVQLLEEVKQNKGGNPRKPLDEKK